MAVTDSILLSVKSMLDIQEADESFDQNLILHINAVLMILNQLGIGTAAVFSITGADETWADFIPAVSANYGLVKTYMMLKVKSVFDPTGSAVIAGAYDRTLTEYEGRLIVQAEQ